MKTDNPKRGIDWDVFEIWDFDLETELRQVQRIDEADSMTDDEAVECARNYGILCDDNGLVVEDLRKNGIDCDDRGYIINIEETK